MNTKFPVIIYPTYEITYLGKLIGILKKESIFGIDHRLMDPSGKVELAYFSHPMTYVYYQWTIRITNESISQKIDPNLYPFIARTLIVFNKKK